MSRRYNITLFNRITGEEHYFQLFGNNQWFPTFEKYLDSKGINYRNDYPYISDENPLEITDLTEFVQVIDETVFYDVIHGGSKPTLENYSKYFNFTENFAYKNDNKAIPHTSIYDAALSIFNNSYIFQSYHFIQWLIEHEAIINKRIMRTKHKYNLDADQDDNFTILGDLDNDYKLTLTYW